MKNILPSLRIGMTSQEVILEIARINPTIGAFFFAFYTPAKHQKERIPDRLVRHNPPKEIIEVKKESLIPQKLQTLSSMLYRPNELDLLAFTSEVKIEGKGVFHLPLMDFDCQATEENLKKIEWFLTRLTSITQEEGVILSSGYSYHYYGLRPLSLRKWMTFVGACLLFDEVDVHYVGYQLMDGRMILRISTSKQHPKIPTVVSILNAGR